MKECPKYTKWLAKRCDFPCLVCSEVNLALIPPHTWWIDTGATIHMSSTMQGCIRSRTLSQHKRFIYLGNDNKVRVEAVAVYRLKLESDYFLDLDETFYVPSFRRNLIYVSLLDKPSYSCSFGNGKFSLFQSSNVVGTRSLVDYLYKLDLHASHISESLYVNSSGLKHRLINENSSMLWHKHLGHISRERLERLVSKGILNLLDFTDFKICVECVKGKQTNIRKLGSNRSSGVLEVIHTDICGPFPIASWNGQHYFITFIDDYSRYGYIYLIHEKSQVLDVFIKKI